MKASVAPATTRKVLAGIDAVLRERTAEAVGRVLSTASPGHGPFPSPEASRLAFDLCSGAFPTVTTCPEDCPGWVAGECFAAEIDFNSLPGMTDAQGFHGLLGNSIETQRRRYAPWVVSPHLFGGGS